MSRRSTPLEYCMLCDSAPCQCSLAKPARKITTVNVIKELAPPPVPELQAPKRLTLAKVKPVLKVQPPRLTVELTDDDLLLHEALRALAPLLGYDDLAKWSSVLKSSLSTADKARVWRARRKVS